MAVPVYASGDATNYILVAPLKSDSILNKISSLRKALQSSVGPNGRTKLIGNVESDEVKIGSSSSLLLNSPLIDDDDDAIIKLITESVKQHLKIHYDFGLYCAVLCLSLVEHGMKLELSQCLVAECYRLFLNDLVSHIKNESSCSVVRKIDVGKMKPLVDLLKDVVGSKPSLALKPTDVEEMSISFLKAYLKCMVPDTRTTVWPVLCFQQTCNNNSVFAYNGLLLDLHHHTSECIKELCADVSMKCGMQHVIVLNISLTLGDLAAEAVPVRSEDCSEIEKFLHKELYDFADRVLKLNISVVFNQKVVSENLKLHFKKSNILVIDRIGMQAMESLTRITGAKAMSHIQANIELYKGCLDEILALDINRKTYIHVKKQDKPICTIVACYSNPAVLQDLKHVCWGAISSLETTLRCQKIIKGGGQLELYLVDYVEKKYRNLNQQKLSCSPGQLQACVHAFCSSLKSLLSSHSDITEHVYDCFGIKLNALVVAIQTAALVLEIKYQIKQ